ncbi:MAG: hypothetical protein GX971_13865 [Firmicutes bacterium]|nr:hypothetical protein [Bacillota bacterium]
MILIMAFCCVQIFPVTSHAEDDREGYWECIDVRHEMKHFNEELVDTDYWSYSMDGSAGKQAQIECRCICAGSLRQQGR